MTEENNTTMEVPSNDQTDLVVKNAPDTEPLFVVDTTQHSSRTCEAPLYHENIMFLEKNDDASNNEKKKEPTQKQNSCWNCSSTNHALMNCPKPRDQRTITKNRQLFKAQKLMQPGGRNNRNRASAKRFTRYYLEDGPENKYDKFVPGKLSIKLVKALGVPKNGLPIHIYRMRKFGYPNGWLEEAKVKHSGITLFVDANQSEPLSKGEDGEIDVINFKIDMGKLYKYPGFNTPSPPNTIDDHKKYDCPRFDPNQSLQNMCDKFKDYKLNPYKRAKLLFPGDTTLSNEEMDIVTSSDENVRLPEEITTLEVKPIDYLPSSPEDGEILESENNVFKEIKPELAEINTSFEANGQNHLETSEYHSVSIYETSSKELVEKECENQNSSVISNFENNEQVDSEKSLNSTSESPTKKQFSELKCEFVGTPVLKRFSSYENRPDHDKFSKGMVDIIDHENLPNATGTFSKLKEILKDVRKTLNSLL
ncbi:zinc finger CCHC domain-containing protein 8 homolog [Daktulosphaira vitifoliae]|uniref:zinc finger CCHC domain-containing protein 8 homolog n=1 Tax=Daktulosphaira vitifoliae TaxID=58002 RepID=UPI0021A9BB21|nr:zinc finger CCHC domain-containing protein 8 homolog [Daktulosphaira vitifoliae]